MKIQSTYDFEQLRKPVSQVIATAFILVALLTIPRGFENAWHELLEWSGYLCLIVAAIGRIWCSIYIAGKKDKELCTQGPYSLCRNPLYLFSLIGVIGFFLALQSLLLCTLAILTYLLYYRKVILSEEQRLSQIFGASFQFYLKSTPRLIPHFRAFTRQESSTISPRILERGLTEIIWFLVAIVLIDVLEMIHHQGIFVWGTLPF